MRRSFYLLLLLLLVTFGSSRALGQNCPVKQLSRPVPNPTKPVNFEQIMGAIDVALENVKETNSNLIIIIKMEKKSSLSLAKSRTIHIGDYLKRRGFKNYKIAIDPEEGDSGLVDLYVAGELLYSLSLKKKDELIPGGLD